MAGKTMELAIAIKGKLDGSLPASLQKTNSQISQLSSKIRAMKSEQASYDAALRNGMMTQETYNAVSSRMASSVNSAVAMQNRLRNSVISTNNTARNMGSIGSMFTAPFSAASGAISGLTGKLAMCQEKIMGFAALAAGGFGLVSLISGAAETGESIYQLSTKLHMTAAEAGQFKRVLSLTGADADSAAKAIARMDKSAIASGKSGDAMRATLEGWGVVVTDSEGKLLPVNEQLKNLAAGYKVAAAEGMEQEFVMATLGTKGMELAKTLQNYDEVSKEASKIKSVGMDPQQMHEMYLQMQELKMQASQFGLVFASAIAPIVAELLPPIMDAMSQLATLISQNKDVIAQYILEALKIGAAFVGIKTVIGTVSGVLGGVGGAIRLVATAFKGESVLLLEQPGMWLAQKAAMGITKAATVAMTGAQAALNAIMAANPVALAILAFVALAAALVYLWNTNEEFRAAVINAWNNIKAAAIQIWAAIVPVITQAWDAIKAAAERIWEAIVPLVTQMWGQIKTAAVAAWGVLVPIISAVWEKIKFVINIYLTPIIALITLIASHAGQIWEDMLPIVSAVWNFVAAIISGAFSIIVTFIMSSISVIAAVWNGIVGVVSAVWDAITGVINGDISIIDAIVMVGAAYINAVWGIIGAVASAVWDMVGAVASAAFGVIKSEAEIAMAVISAAWDLIVYAAQAAWDMIVSAVQAAWNTVMSIINAGISDVTAKWEALKNIFSSPITAVVNFVKGGNSEAQSAAADAGESARGGIFSSPYLTWVAEAGSPEAIVPLDGSSRAYALWQKAGKMLGVMPTASTAVNDNAASASPMTVSAPIGNSNSINMTFNPTINVSGGTGADVSGQIREALAEQARQFKEQLPRMMADIHAGQRRLSYE